MAPFFRILTVAVVLAFAALLALSFSSIQPLSTPADATKIVFDDLKSDPLIASNSYRFSLFSAEQAADGQWQVVVKVTLEPNSACPKAFVRTYRLLPIRHGIDKTITSDCSHGTPVAFPEEAIIAAYKTGAARSVQPLVSACGYELPLVESKVREYCPDADMATLNEAASRLPPSAKWLTEWTGGGTRVLVALDSNGNEVFPR